MSLPFFFLNRTLLADFALRNRIASTFAFREWVAPEAYCPTGQASRGCTNGLQTIEQPTKFELVINLKTANELGMPSRQRCSRVPTR
jgi:hypothetical protein